MKKKQDPLEATLQNLALFSLAIHKFNKNTEKELNLSLVQFHVLSAVLETPGVSAQSLAKATGVHPSSLTQTMKILIRKGMLFVDESPRDSRKKIILATKSGKVAVDYFKDAIPKLLNHFLEKPTVAQVLQEFRI